MSFTKIFKICSVNKLRRYGFLILIIIIFYLLWKHNSQVTSKVYSSAIQNWDSKEYNLHGKEHLHAKESTLLKNLYFWKATENKLQSGNIMNFVENIEFPITCNVNEIGKFGLYPRAVLNTKFGQKTLFVYDNDIASANLISNKIFSAQALNEMLYILEKEEDMNLIDLGCNFGIFTISAALEGRKVIAVDANLENLKRLRQSICINGLENNIRLINGAVSNASNADILFAINLEHSGASQVLINAKPTNVKNMKIIETKSISLDDLIPIIKFKKFMLKLDIEGSEWNAIRGARRLFQEFPPKYVIMEVLYFSDQVLENFMNFFNSKGYTPYLTLANKTRFELHDERPRDIIWSLE